MRKYLLAAAALSCMAASPAFADCSALPNHAALVTALKSARGADNGGLNNDMWGTVVDRAGVVCAVAFTGAAVDSQWPGSRLISAQKANTANAFSVKGFALSTANLYAPTQPGGPLFGLQESNPVNLNVAYSGTAAQFGGTKDPLVGKAIGGVNVFGGGLPLYNSTGDIVGGLGVSGDTSCADHNIAWRTRNNLKLDFVPAGVSKDKNDQVMYDIGITGKSGSGYGQPVCGGKEDDIAKDLPATVMVETTKPAEAAAPAAK